MTTRQKQEALQRAILADRAKRQTPEPSSALMPCFACERPFRYRGPNGDDSGRFCSDKCRQAYDDGYRSPREKFDPFASPLPWIIVAGPPGAPAGSIYGKLNKDLAAQRRRVEDRLGKIPDEDLTRPRRTCAQCGSRIPVWIKGKKVSERRKLCLTCSPL